MHREIILERADDARALPPGHRLAGPVLAGSRLDFDGDHDRAAPRDQIDLARAAAIAPGQDAVALQTQQPETKSFGPQTAAEGFATALPAAGHRRSPLRWSARA